jgi:cyclomaltodextrinase / maltogenic alpha-amylase / neopullulanase
VREYDVDGFRVDAAWGVHTRAPEFFPAVRGELRRIKSDVVLIGEASALEPAYFLGSFDAAYDWTWELGEWAWDRVFTDAGGLDLAALHGALTADGEGHPPGARILRFLNNNDTGERFFTRHGFDRARVATALMLSLPGIPSFFMGDESAEAYEPYQRLEPLRLDPHPPARDWIRRWTTLRAQHRALREGDFVPVQVVPGEHVYAYLRTLEGEDPLLVVLNFTSQPITVDLRLPEPWRGHFERRPLRDLASERRVASADTERGLRLALPAHAAWLIDGVRGHSR